MSHSRTRRLSALTLMVAVTALCVAACGSSSNTGSSSAAASASSSSSASGSSSSGGHFNRSTFVACLKSHGVTLPNRPAGAGGGEGGAPPSSGSGSGSGSTTRPRGGFFFGGGGGAGRFANNPKLQAAMKACGGGRSFGTGRRFTLSHAAVDKFVACVKAHGYNLPAPNFSGKGGIFPSSIEKNAKFQAAAKSCASDLRPAGAGGPGGGAPPPGSSGAASGSTSTT